MVTASDWLPPNTKKCMLSWPTAKTDMAARSAFKDHNRASDWLHRLPEQQPVSDPIGIGAQRAEQGLIGQGHANAGFHEIAAPPVFARIVQRAAIAAEAGP